MWMSLHLKDRYSELRVHLNRFLPLMSMKCPSLSFLMTFGWKSILFDIRMATPACFLEPFAWKIVFQRFTLRYCLSLPLRWISCIQQNAGLCLHSQSVILCLFIGELIPLMLWDSKETWLLLLVIFVFRGRIMLPWLSSFKFVERLLSYFFLGCSIPPCVGVFHLLSFVRPYLWEDIV